MKESGESNKNLNKIMIRIIVCLLLFIALPILFFQLLEHTQNEPKIKVGIYNSSEYLDAELIADRINYGSVNNITDLEPFKYKQVILRVQYNNKWYIFGYDLGDDDRIEIGIPMEYFNDTFIDTYDLYPYLSYKPVDLYPNDEQVLHYYSNNISYSLSPSCKDNQERRMMDAFSILENATSNTLRFYNESYLDSDIKIRCKNEYILSPFEDEEYTVGEGMPAKLYGNIILNGEVNLYSDYTGNSYSCFDFPATEVHELLHTFGFAHYDSPYDIMYPEENDTSCGKLDSINTKYSECIKSIYDNDTSLNCKDINFLDIE